MTTHTRRVGRSRVSRPVLLMLRRSYRVWLVVVAFCRLGSWYQLVMLESVAGDMCFGYGDRSAALNATVAAALNATVDVSDVLITSGNGVPGR
jgi:hypothetical protein